MRLIIANLVRNYQFSEKIPIYMVKVLIKVVLHVVKTNMSMSAHGPEASSCLLGLYSLQINCNLAKWY